MNGTSVNEGSSSRTAQTVVKKFKWRRVYVGFKDNIWAVELAETGTLSFSCGSVKYYYMWLLLLYLFSIHQIYFS